MFVFLVIAFAWSPFTSVFVTYELECNQVAQEWMSATSTGGHNTGDVLVFGSDVDITNNDAIGNIEFSLALMFDTSAITEKIEVISATIQFTASRTSSGPISIDIFAELQALPSPLTMKRGPLLSGTPFNVTRRFANSTQAVAWSPTSWTKGDSSSAQITTNVAEPLRQVMSLPDWQAGNPIVFLMKRSDSDHTKNHRQARGARWNDAPFLRILARKLPQTKESE
eukprot:c6826_g1_i1.p1 GENE.c6826_g1_i1~~c6826_g1_i1.p1  ORF type:complete len:225 (+),score=20.66 c6826_g1_i1:199-873(+)